MKHFSESELLEKIKKGEESALGYLYSTNYRPVQHFIMNNNGSEQDAKDIYQEAVIIFYEKLTKSGLGLSCQVGTFLYSIARRLWLRKLADKSNYAGKIEDFEEFIEVKEEKEEYNEARFQVMGMSLSLLGEPCRTLIEDFYFQNLTMQQITEKFGYTNADNAKNQKYKCLNRLKKLFFDHYKGGDKDE